MCSPLPMCSPASGPAIAWASSSGAICCQGMAQLDATFCTSSSRTRASHAASASLGSSDRSTATTIPSPACIPRRSSARTAVWRVSGGAISASVMALLARRTASPSGATPSSTPSSPSVSTAAASSSSGADGASSASGSGSTRASAGAAGATPPGTGTKLGTPRQAPLAKARASGLGRMVSRQPGRLSFASRSASSAQQAIRATARPG